MWNTLFLILGFITLSTGTSIKPTDNSTDPRLIVANTKSIVFLTMDGEYLEGPEPNAFSNVRPLDIDHLTQKAYFVDVEDKRVFKISIATDEDTFTVETVMRHSADGIAALSVDWIGRKLYILNEAERVLRVCELNGSRCKSLLSGRFTHPRGMAVYPQKGFMDIDGTNRHKLNVVHTPGVYGLAVFDDYLYWSDWNLQRIYRANKFNGDGEIELTNMKQLPSDIRALHGSTQPPGRNPCGTDNGGCSHLCLISPGGESYRCECPDQFTINDDNSTCIANCALTDFPCTNGDRCIPRKWLCDKDNDCADGSDEENCPDNTCDDGMFQCSNGNCIDETKKCDGENDCKDTQVSDENEFNCPRLPIKCRGVKRRCPNTNICITPSDLCDGYNDCGDSADEIKEYCFQQTCGSL